MAYNPQAARLPQPSARFSPTLYLPVEFTATPSRRIKPCYLGWALKVFASINAKTSPEPDDRADGTPRQTQVHTEHLGMEAIQEAFDWTLVTLFCISAMFVHFCVSCESVVARVGAGARNIWPRLDETDGTRYIALASLGPLDGMHSILVADGHAVGDVSRNPHGNRLDANGAPRRRASLPVSQDLPRQPAANETGRGLNASSTPGEMEQYFTYATRSTLEDIAGGDYGHCAQGQTPDPKPDAMLR